MIDLSLGWPLDQLFANWRISQPFGSHAVDYSAWGLDRHAGLDISAPVGTKLYAPASGSMIYGNEPDGFGVYARITTPEGYRVYLAHLENASQIFWSPKPVVRGDYIGTIGLTGNTGGAHTHMEIRSQDINNGLKGAFNPLPYMEDFPMNPLALLIPQWEREAAYQCQFLQDSMASVCKLIEPDHRPYNIPASCRPILRYHVPDGHPANDLWKEGWQGGVQMWRNYLRPRFDATPQSLRDNLLCVESWCEPSTESVESCRKLGDAEAGLVDAALQDDVLIGTGCFGEGQPGGDDDERRAKIAALRGSFTGAYWMPHLYYNHQQLDIWHAFRHELNIQYMHDAQIRVPPIIIGEAGIDLGTIGKTGGWQEVRPAITAATFLAEFINPFLTRLATCPYVAGVSYFIGDPTWPRWTSFAWTQAMQESMAYLILTRTNLNPQVPAPDPEPIPEPEPEPEPQPEPEPPEFGTIADYIGQNQEDIRRVAYSLLGVSYLVGNSIDAAMREQNQLGPSGRLLGWTWAGMQDGGTVVIHAYEHFIVATIPDHYDVDDLVILPY